MTAWQPITKTSVQKVIQYLTDQSTHLHMVRSSISPASQRKSYFSRLAIQVCPCCSCTEVLQDLQLKMQWVNWVQMMYPMSKHSVQAEICNSGTKMNLWSWIDVDFWALEAGWLRFGYGLSVAAHDLHHHQSAADRLNCLWERQKDWLRSIYKETVEVLKNVPPKAKAQN